MFMDKKLFINDLYLFYRYFIASRYEDSVPAPHIKELSRKLMKLVSGDGKSRLAVSMPPRHSKSSMVTLAFPLWLILQNPKLHIMIVCGSQALVEKFGIQLREQVDRIGEHFDVYLSDVKYSNSHLMFNDEEGNLYDGEIKLFTSGGGITGNDADYLIVDDPYVGREEEFTPSGLQKKIDWANRVIEQRIEPQTKYCILHTRWNSNDIIGFYKRTEPEEYEFVEFPAIKEDGNPLWKQRYTIDELLKKRKRQGERLFSAIYQQQPLDTTSNFFNLDKLNFGLPEDYGEEIICRAWDIAGGDEIDNNDFTAGVKLVKSGEYYVVTDLVHGRFGNNTLNIIRNTAVNDGVGCNVVIETGVAGAGKLLYEEWKTQLKGYKVERADVTGGKSKADRATPLKNAIEDGYIYIDINDDVLRDSMLGEMKSFPNGEHDDIVDAMAHCYNYVFMKDKSKRTAKMGIVYL